MKKKTVRAISIALATVASFSAIFTSSALGYYEDLSLGLAPRDVSVDISVGDNNGGDEIDTDDPDGTSTLSINLMSAGGHVIIDEGKEDEQMVLLEKPDDGNVYIDVYDKDGVMLSRGEVSEDGLYTYPFEIENGMAVNVKALADENCVVWKYDVAEEGVSEETGFQKESFLEEFEYPVILDTDKDLYVSFVDAGLAEVMVEEGSEEDQDLTLDPDLVPAPKGDDLTVDGNITVTVPNEESGEDGEENGDISVAEPEGESNDDLSVETDAEEEQEGDDTDEDTGDEPAEESADPSEDPGSVTMPSDGDVSIDTGEASEGVEEPEEEPDVTPEETEPATPDDEGTVAPEDTDAVAPESTEPTIPEDVDPEANPDDTEEDPGAQTMPNDDLSVEIGDLPDTENSEENSEDVNPEENLDGEAPEEQEPDQEGSDEELPENSDEGETLVVQTPPDENSLSSSVVALESAAVATGEQANLLINAKNASDVSTELDLYFCEINEEMSEDKQVWDVYLKSPAMTVESEDLEGEDGLQVSLRMDDGSSMEENLRMSWGFEDGEPVSKYASMELPARSETDIALSVYSKEDASLTVIPVIVYGEGSSVYGETASVVWKTPEDADGDEEQQPEKPEHFLENVAGTEILDASKFSTARLVVMTDNPKTVIDPEHLIANYGNIYLLQYGSQEQAMNAYMYYSLVASAVEPDTAMSVADGDLHVTGGSNDTSSMTTYQEITDLHVGGDTGSPETDETQNAPEETQDPEAQDPATQDPAVQDTETSQDGSDLHITVPETVDPNMSQETTDPEAQQPEEPDQDIQGSGESGSETDSEGSDETEESDGTEPVEIKGISITPDNNPIAILSDEVASTEAQNESKVIALIDTGVAPGPNIIDRVSLIDDVLNGGIHGDDMAKFITEENPGAKILSIRALGNDGYGSISAVVSGIEYAINSQVDIINLSLYSEKSLTTSVLEIEIQKALDSGITVVGSAGNDGMEVSRYVPGSIDGVQSIGSVNADGARRGFSNYGDLVDYYVVSDSTSEAAARFSGYISLYGIDAVSEDDSGWVFTEAGDPLVGDKDIHVNTTEFDSTKYEDTIYDPIIENYVKQNLNSTYVKGNDLHLVNYMPVSATLVREEDIGPEDNADTICGVGENLKLIMQHTGRVPVYQIGEDDTYLVAYADLMHNDSRARIVDHLLGRNSTEGITVDNYYFDEETGLMYIPKTDFIGEDGEFYLSYLRSQIIYAISGFNYNSDWNSATVAVTERENGGTEELLESDNAMMPFMDVRIGKHMDVNSMLVCVNGLPVDGENYAYSPEDGILSLGFSSCLVQSIWVQAERSPDGPDVDPGGEVKAAATNVAFSDMKPVSDTPVEGSILSLQPGDTFDARGLMKYPEGHHDNIWGGKVETGVRRDVTYVPWEDNDPENAGNHMIDWIQGGANGNPPATKYVEGQSSGNYVFPFILQANSINCPELNTTMLPSTEIYLACTHLGIEAPDKKYYLNENGEYIDLHFAVLEVNKDEGYIVLAIYSQQVTTQNAISILKFIVQEKEGALKITKQLTDKDFGGISERVRLQTEFTVYRDKGCNSKYTNSTFNGVIELKDEDENPKTVASATVEGLPEGDYYLKETGRCPGCQQNDKVYKFHIDPDKTTTDFEIVKGGSGKVKYIENPPLRSKFKIIKTDISGAQNLEGAVFRVKYYKKIADRDAHKNQYRTWFFKTGSDGIAEYCEEDFLQTWTNPKGKTFTSDDPIKTKDGEWLLPLGYLTVKEIGAPAGYDINPDVFKAQIGSDDPSKLESPAVEVPVKDSNYNDWKVQIKTKKVDRNHKELEGAVFSVWLDEKCKEDYAGTLTSKADGTTDVLQVEVPENQDKVTLYLKEETAPNGFALSDEIYEVEYSKSDFVEPDGELKDFRPTGEPDGIPNDPGWKISADLLKVDEDGNKLAGASFDIFDDPGCTHKVGSIDTLDDGSTVFSMGVPLTQDQITLYAKETKAPDGYSMSTEVYELKFTKAEYDALTEAQQNGDGVKKTFGADVTSTPNVSTTPAPETNVVMIGDSRTVHLSKAVNATAFFSEGSGATEARYSQLGNDYFFAKCSQGYYWLKDTGWPAAQSHVNSNTALVIWLGVNDYEYAATLYANFLKNLNLNGAKLYYVEAGKEKSSHAADNPKIQAFNDKVKAELGSSATWITVNDVIDGIINSQGEDAAFAPGDYLHYSNTTSNAIWEKIKSSITGSSVTPTPDPGAVKGIVNKKGWPVRLKAKKVDGSGTGLEGATFGIYDDPSCSNRLGELTSTSTGETDEFSFVVPKDQDSITFYCKELNPPSGYNLKEDVWEVTFSKSEWDALSPTEKKLGVLKWIFAESGIINEQTTGTPTPSTPITPFTAGVYVQKETTANEDIMDLESYDLLGAEFEVVNEDTNEVLGTLTVGEKRLLDYLSEILPLPDNSTPAGPKITNYLVRETKPPKGHILCNDVYRFHVTMPIDKDKVFKAPFIDEPYFDEHDFRITKLGPKGEAIQGVVYKVELFDSDSPDPDKLKRTWYLESDANGIVLMDKAHLSTRKGYVSDDFYMHRGQIVIPVGCYLQVTEVSAPAEYVLDETPFNFMTAQDAELSKEVRDDSEPCSIKIKKYAQDGTTVLTGVEFKLTFVKEAVESKGNNDPNFHRLLEPGESITLNTDINGEVLFENLDQGTYMIEELRTVPGQNLLKEPIYVTLPLKMSEEEALEYGNVDFGSAKLDESYTDTWFFFDCTFEITNSPTLHLPLTGNNGMWKYGIIGVGLLGALTAWLVLYGPNGRKRKRFKI